MANKQISDLQARTFDGDSIIAHDVENTDPSTMSQKPYLTGSATGHAVADFVANGEEFTTDLDTVDKHITGAINELNTGKQDIIPDTVAKTVTFDVTPSGGEVKAKVYNRVLYVSGYFRFSANQSANTQLLHISDVTLAMEIFESCFTDGSSTVRFKLTTDGKLINENQFQANQWVSISLACLLA